MRYPYVPGSVEAHDAAVAVFRGGTVPAEPVPAPEVVARPPRGPDEIADGNGQALATGSLALKHGWQVSPYYYRDAAGESRCALRLDRGTVGGESRCALRLQRGTVAAVITWQRGNPSRLTLPRPRWHPPLRLTVTVAWHPPYVWLDKWTKPVAYAWQLGEADTFRRLPIAELRAHLKTPPGAPLPPRTVALEAPGKDWTKQDALPRNQWLASGQPLLKVRKGRR